MAAGPEGSASLKLPLLLKARPGNLLGCSATDEG
jgi:hypothetical protein